MTYFTHISVLLSGAILLTVAFSPATVQAQEEQALPTEDQASGDEPIARYPGSVMLSHRKITVDGDVAFSIEYGTEDSVGDVVSRYEEELGDPFYKKTGGEDGETVLAYKKLEDYPVDFAALTVTPGDYTTIELKAGDERFGQR